MDEGTRFHSEADRNTAPRRCWHRAFPCSPGVRITIVSSRYLRPLLVGRNSVSIVLGRVRSVIWPLSFAECVVVVLVVLGGSLCVGSRAAPPADGPLVGDGTEGDRALSDTTAPIVRKVQIKGNDHFSAGTLKNHVRTTQNRRILGIPGLTWWRWVYRLGEADWMWNRLGESLKSGGEPPAYIDSTTVGGDVERLQLFYEQRGFFDAAVTSRIQPHPSDNQVTVTFRVESGAPTFVRHVRYEGLGVLTAAQKREFGRETVLDYANGTAETPLSFRTEGERYRKSVLLDERRRAVSFLQNEGYAAVTRDSIRAIVEAKTTPPGSLDVTFRVQTGPRYRFGDVHFRITGPERAPARRDTLALPVDTTGGRHPLVTSHIEKESQLGTALLRRSLQFVPGAVYDQSSVRATKQRLEGAGLFTFTSVSPQFDQVTGSDSVRYLPLRVEAQTQRRHQLRLETFGLQRVPETDFGSNELGVGVGGGYTNVNALGGGERFQLSTSASVSTSLDSTFFTSSQFEGTASLTLPYLIRPFRFFENVFDLANAQTQVSLSFLRARRNELRLRIRSRNNARLRLEMNHTPTRTSLVDVFDLSISNPDTLAGFQDRFLDTLFVGVEDPFQRAQVLDDYTQPQINTALRYTFRSATANPLRRRQGHIYELSGEVGNTMPFLLDRFVFEPDTVDYTLPGLTGGEGGLSGDLLFRPYVRGSVDLRRYRRLSRGTTLALKFFGGMAHPTGGPPLIPLDRRFFSGGASSVRGWRLRQLGPGGSGRQVDSTGTRSGTVTGILGGDIKLETSVELRTTLLRNILAANWTGAPFLDVGNVWFGPRNEGFGAAPQDEDDGSSEEEGDNQERQPDRPSSDQSGRFRGISSLTDVGVGGGVGLRIAWDFLIVRFDLAYRLHDPTPRNDDIFSDNFSGPLLHFGIGHAF